MTPAQVAQKRENRNRHALLVSAQRALAKERQATILWGDGKDMSYEHVLKDAIWKLMVGSHAR